MAKYINCTCGYSRFSVEGGTDVLIPPGTTFTPQFFPESEIGVSVVEVCDQCRGQVQTAADVRALDLICALLEAALEAAEKRHDHYAGFKAPMPEYNMLGKIISSIYAALEEMPEEEIR